MSGAGRVSDYNATGGPNSSAEDELRLAELVSWGRVWQLRKYEENMIYSHSITLTEYLSPTDGKALKWKYTARYSR